MNKDNFIKKLGAVRSNSTFLTLKGYKTEFGEVADYNVLFHADYETALLRSITALNGIIPTNFRDLKAKRELVASFTNSINNIQNGVESRSNGSYTRFKNKDGEYIKGIKMHNETGDLYLFGLVVNKRVHSTGTLKDDNRQPLTIAKDKLRKVCPVSKFRSFKIKASQLDSISIENCTVRPPQ